MRESELHFSGKHKLYGFKVKNSVSLSNMDIL